MRPGDAIWRHGFQIMACFLPRTMLLYDLSIDNSTFQWDLNKTTMIFIHENAFQKCSKFTVLFLLLLLLFFSNYIIGPWKIWMRFFPCLFYWLEYSCIFDDSVIKWISCVHLTLGFRLQRGRLNIKMQSYQYGDSHYKDNTVGLSL